MSCAGANGVDSGSGAGAARLGGRRRGSAAPWRRPARADGSGLREAGCGCGLWRGRLHRRERGGLERRGIGHGPRRLRLGVEFGRRRRLEPGSGAAARARAGGARPAPARACGLGRCRLGRGLRRGCREWRRRRGGGRGRLGATDASGATARLRLGVPSSARRARREKRASRVSSGSSPSCSAGSPPSSSNQRRSSGSRPRRRRSHVRALGHQRRGRPRRRPFRRSTTVRVAPSCQLLRRFALRLVDANGAVRGRDRLSCAGDNYAFCCGVAPVSWPGA